MQSNGTDTFININELTNEQYEREMNFICPQKHERVSRMRFEDDKKRSLAANLAARRASADFLGIDEDEIRITCDGSEKPLCDGCYISLSHSGDYAVCAVSSFPIGVDIEKKRDVNPKLINKYASTMPRGNMRQIRKACLRCGLSKKPASRR